MKMSRLGAVASGLVATLVWSAPWAQVGCQSLSGTWTDNFDWTWPLVQTASTITGAVQSPGHPCGDEWPAQGTHLGNGTFNIRATNPNGESETCSAWFEYSGMIHRPGCHTGFGSWYSSVENEFGPWDWDKACDIPTTEFTTSTGTWVASVPTAHTWRAVLHPSSINFVGRTISEQTDPPGSIDTCWFPGSSFAKVTGVTGNSALITQNNEYFDLIGFMPGAVSYYRYVGRAPCDATTPQRMHIDCADSTPAYNYNQLAIGIGTTTVSSSRSGQTVIRIWP